MATMDNSDSELAYLQPGFTLSSLTVPKLRSVLVSHDVPYPSAAKKPQLIQLVEERVLPQSRKILNARARTKRTSKGITDVPSSQEGSTAEDGDEGQMLPPQPPSKPTRGRKSKSALTAEDMITNKDLPATPATPAASRRSRTPGTRKSVVKHPRYSDTDTEASEVRPSSRKTRKSETPVEVTPPRVHIDEPDLPLRSERRIQAETAFTHDNPFQSGSSPSADSRGGVSGSGSGSGSRSRKSLGAQKEDQRRPSATRRRTTTPKEAAVKQEDGITAPSRSTFEFPALRPESNQQDSVQPTEEFTPEEQLELVRDRAAQGYSGKDLLPSRPLTLTRRKRKSSSTATKSATWGVLITLLGSIGAWYRKEKIDIGYCGVGQPEWSLSNYNTNIPSWVQESLQPACEPCPQHAFCYSDMQVKCEPDFVVKPHPLSLAGLIPLPPTCEPDGEKVRRAKAVADRAVEELRERRAAFECGEEVPQDSAADEHEETKPLSKGAHTKLEMAEDALRQKVGKMKRKDLSDSEFDDLWQGALGEITGREEVEVSRDGTGRIFLSSTSLVRLPFACSIRRSLLRTLSRNRIPLSLLTAALLAAVYARRRLTSYKNATAQIPMLVNTTLDRLATQAALAADGRLTEGFISEGQLRDDVLRSTMGKDERQRLWRGVKSIVEQNSNVRAGEREGERTGEWSRVWEWIGPLDVVKASELEGGRRRSSRKSGGGFVSEPDQGTDSDGDMDVRSKRTGRGQSKIESSRKWDEGRPMY